MSVDVSCQLFTLQTLFESSGDSSGKAGLVQIRSASATTKHYGTMDLSRE